METENIKWLLVWIYLIPASIVLGMYMDAVPHNKFTKEDHIISIVMTFCPVLNILVVIYYYYDNYINKKDGN